MNNHSTSNNESEFFPLEELEEAYQDVQASLDSDDDITAVDSAVLEESLELVQGKQTTAVKEPSAEGESAYEEAELKSPNEVVMPVVSSCGHKEQNKQNSQRKKEGKKSFFQQFSFGESDFKGGKKRVTFNQVIGGDILTNDFFRRQVKLLILLLVFAIIYISNRYSFQQEMIEIENLKQELTDIKYDALTRSSELTEKSRQSHIQEYISQGGSTLETATQPPYLIK